MKRRDVLIGAGAFALAGAGGAYTAQDMGSMAAYDASIAQTRAQIARDPVVRELIRYATLAPNGHNTQPWKFRMIEGRGVEVWPDFARRTPIVDPDDHHIYASLGCAAENLAIAASVRAQPGVVSYNQSDDKVEFVFGGDGLPADEALLDAIRRRQSTRAPYDGRAVSAEDLKKLAAAAHVPGVDTVVITERAQIDKARDLIIAGNSAQMEDPKFVRELRDWMRFSPRKAMERGDGLFSAASGNPTMPEWIGRQMFDLVFKAQTENDKYAQQLNTSAGVAVFFGAQDDKAHWVAAGRACQRFALRATALGLKLSFVNQPGEVAALRDDMASLAGMRGRRPDIVMRFGYGPTLPYAPRRAVSAVLV